MLITKDINFSSYSEVNELIFITFYFIVIHTFF